MRLTKGYAALARAGMYVGCMYQEYADLQVAAARKLPPQAVIGSGLSFMVGRMSYTFGLTGPCVSTDTACSSSLVSTHLAHKARRLWALLPTSADCGLLGRCLRQCMPCRGPLTK